MKKIYIAPDTYVAQLTVTHIMATSGPEIGDGDADQDAGMDVKSNQFRNTNIWDDDWDE